MIVNVPFLYKVSMIKPRHQVAKDYTILGVESFEIKEISSQQTQLVGQATIEQKDYNGLKEYFNLVDYRLYKDGLIKPFGINLGSHLYSNTRLIKQTINSEQLQHVFDQWMGNHINNETARTNGFYAGVFYNWFTTVQKDQGYKRNVEHENNFDRSLFVHSTRNQVLENLKTTIDKFCIVDGQVFCPTEGPVYRVDFESLTIAQCVREKIPYDRYLRAVTVKVLEENNLSYQYAKSIFSLKQKDLALTYANRLKRKNNSEHPIVNLGKIEVFNWHAFDENKNWNDILTQTCMQTMISMNDELSSMSADAIEHFARLKRSLDSFKNCNNNSSNDLNTKDSNNSVSFENLFDQLKQMHTFRLEYYGNNISKDKQKPYIEFEKAIADRKDPKSDELFVSLEDLENLENSNTQDLISLKI